MGRNLWVGFVVLAMACTSARGSRNKDTGGSDGFQGNEGGSEGFVAGDGSDGADTADSGDGSDGGPAADGVDAGDGTSTESCTSDAECSGGRHCGPDGVCVECLEDGHCTGGASEVCFEYFCTACAAGVRTCSGLNVTECVDGQPKVVESCPADGVCNSGQCYACYPGIKQCDSSGRAIECITDGTPAGTSWQVKQDCATQGMQCASGQCKGGCGFDPKGGTNAGCEFWALDLDNATDGINDAASAPFAIIASNTSSSATATVTLTLPDGTERKKDVAPLSLEVFDTISPSFGINEPGISKNGFHLVSNQPITVYQFNPLSNVGVFSNDASVLLPVGAAGTRYFLMTRQAIDTDFDQFRGFGTIVALDNDTTVDVVATTGATAGAAGQLSPGVKQSFTLQKHEVLNIESETPGGDLTGTEIITSKPVVLYSGHEAAVTSTQCCADHLEQQMVPVPAWGKSYILARSKKRGLEKEYFRIVAAEDGTNVTVNPAVISPPSFVLNKGQWKEIVIDGDFQVSATQPIMVAQFLASSFEVPGPMPASCSSPAECPPSYDCDTFGGQCFPPTCFSSAECPAGHVCAQDPLGSGCAPIGDPSLILAVPAEQWQTDYIFLTPSSYAEDYVTIVAEAGSGVVLDNVPLQDSAFTPISGTTYRVYRGAVGDGVHRLKADKKVSVIVYGYDDDVSYGYPGGLGVATLE